MARVILWNVSARFWHWSLFFGLVFLAEKSGLKQEPFGAEVDRGQWLIPPESSKSDGVGKQEKDVLYEG